MGKNRKSKRKKDQFPDKGTNSIIHSGSKSDSIISQSPDQDFDQDLGYNSDGSAYSTSMGDSKSYETAKSELPSVTPLKSQQPGTPPPVTPIPVLKFGTPSEHGTPIKADEEHDIADGEQFAEDDIIPIAPYEGDDQSNVEDHYFQSKQLSQTAFDLSAGENPGPNTENVKDYPMSKQLGQTAFNLAIEVQPVQTEKDEYIENAADSIEEKQYSPVVLSGESANIHENKDGDEANTSIEQKVEPKVLPTDEIRDEQQPTPATVKGDDQKPERRIWSENMKPSGILPDVIQDINPTSTTDMLQFCGQMKTLILEAVDKFAPANMTKGKKNILILEKNKQKLLGIYNDAINEFCKANEEEIINRYDASHISEMNDELNEFKSKIYRKVIECVEQNSVFESFIKEHNYIYNTDFYKNEGLVDGLLRLVLMFLLIAVPGLHEQKTVGKRHLDARLEQRIYHSRKQTCNDEVKNKIRQQLSEPSM